LFLVVLEVDADVDLFSGFDGIPFFCYFEFYDCTCQCKLSNNYLVSRFKWHLDQMRVLVLVLIILGEFDGNADDGLFIGSMEHMLGSKLVCLL
jgi:hypothetical protein